jgi:hypothetical protein
MRAVRRQGNDRTVSVGRRPGRVAILVVCLAFVLCAGLTKRHVVSWNDASRFATVDALVADHSFAIDGSAYTAATGDKIRVRGRTFSDKPPLLSALGAVVAAVLGTIGISLRRTPETAIYLITLLTVGTAFTIGCAYAFAFQRRLGFDERRSAAVAAATGLGTLALPYATVFTNHVPAGVAGLAGTYYLMFERTRPRGAILAGLCLSLAYAFDPGAVVFAVLAIVMLAGSPPRTIALFMAACVPVVALQVGYNFIVTGSALPPIFNHAVWSDPSLPEYIAPATPLVTRFSLPSYLSFVLEQSIGSKGLFVFTPLAAVGVFGLVKMWRAGADLRRLATAIAATAIVLFGLIVVFQNDEFSRNFGERRYVDIAFLGCTSLGVACASVRGALGSIVVRIAVGASVLIAALGTVAPFAGGYNQSGFVFAWQELGTIAHRNVAQACEDVFAACVLLALVLWLMRGALVDERSSRATFHQPI